MIEWYTDRYMGSLEVIAKKKSTAAEQLAAYRHVYRNALQGGDSLCIVGCGQGQLE